MMNVLGNIVHVATGSRDSNHGELNGSMLPTQYSKLLGILPTKITI